MLLSKLSNAKTFVASVERASRDPSNQVRRIVQIEATLRDNGRTRDVVRRAMESPDLLVRASAALVCEDLSDLDALILDESDFVRAVAVRRLPKVVDAVGGTSVVANDGICIALVNSSALTRSNALIAACQLGYLPADTLKGLTVDARPLHRVEELMLSERASIALREEYGLPREYTWEYALFTKQMANSLASLVPIDFTALMPLDERERIGRLAAIALVRESHHMGLAFLQRMTESPIEQSLKQQLYSVLVQMSDLTHE